MPTLEEIRKRFAKNPSAPDEAAAPASSPAALAEASLKLFEPLKRFELQVSEIAKVAEPLERVLNQTARTLDQIRAFESEMERLGRAYDGIRTFQAALSSDAARELREQFDAVGNTFYQNLATAAAVLEPALEFQSRISVLAKVFDGLKPLQEQFNKLAEGFKPQGAQPASSAKPTTIVLEEMAAANNAAANAAVSPGVGNAAVSSNGR
jgi:flagellin-specific chaperone FliS